MRPHCPACGEPCEDDGDRYYADCCFECGWRTEARKRQDEFNNEAIRKRKQRYEALQFAKAFNAKKPS